MMTVSGSASSLGCRPRRFRSLKSADGNGNRKLEQWKKLKLILYAAIQFRSTVGLKNEDATIQEVDDNSLDEREPLRQQQSPQNAQQGSRSERTSGDLEDTSPCTHALDVDGFAARQSSRQQQNLQNTHQSSALIYGRISDTTDHTSPSDCTILGNVGNELGVIQPLARQQTLQNADQISPTTEARISYSGTDHVINIDDREPQMQRTLQNSLWALSSQDAPLADDGIFTLWYSTPLVDENPLNERESLMQQQSPHNTQQGSHLTNERTSDNAEDTSPSYSTLALDEDGLGARQLLGQQLSPQNTCWISASMTYEATDHTSLSDYRVTILENEPDVIQPLTLQQTLQNACQIIGFHRIFDATQFEYMPAAIFVVFYLLVLLHLFRVIG